MGTIVVARHISLAELPLNHKGIAKRERGFDRNFTLLYTMVLEGNEGFDTIALHGGYSPDTEAVFGIGKKETLLVP